MQNHDPPIDGMLPLNWIVLILQGFMLWFLFVDIA
jgi:hypothetical protein